MLLFSIQNPNGTCVKTDVNGTILFKSSNLCSHCSILCIGVLSFSTMDTGCLDVGVCPHTEKAGVFHPGLAEQCHFIDLVLQGMIFGSGVLWKALVVAQARAIQSCTRLSIYSVN